MLPHPPDACSPLPHSPTFSFSPRPRATVQGSLFGPVPKVDAGGSITVVQTRLAPVFDACCAALIADDPLSRQVRLPLFLHCLQFARPRVHPLGGTPFDPDNYRHAQDVDRWGLPFLVALFAKKPLYLHEAMAGQGRNGGFAWAFVPTSTSSYPDHPTIFISSDLSDKLDSVARLLEQSTSQDELGHWEDELDVLEFFVYAILLRVLSYALPRFASLLPPDQSTPPRVPSTLTLSLPLGRGSGEELWERLFGGTVLLGEWASAEAGGHHPMFSFSTPLNRHHVVACLSNGDWREILPAILRAFSAALVHSRLFTANPFAPSFSTCVASSANPGAAAQLVALVGVHQAPTTLAPTPPSLQSPLPAAPRTSPSVSPPLCTPQRSSSAPLYFQATRRAPPPDLSIAKPVPQHPDTLVPVPAELLAKVHRYRLASTEGAEPAADSHPSTTDEQASTVEQGSGRDLDG